jgi:hypothetical protein
MSTVVGECKYMRVGREQSRILIDQEPWQPVDVYIYIFIFVYVYAYVNVFVYVYVFIYIYIHISINKYTCQFVPGLLVCVRVFLRGLVPNHSLDFDGFGALFLATASLPVYRIGTSIEAAG